VGFNNRILVIDDDASIIDAFREVLTASLPAANSSKAELASLLVSDGLPALARRIFQMDSASQGEEGIEKIKAANAQGLPYGLVFTDMRMPPGLDGVETAIAMGAASTF